MSIADLGPLSDAVARRLDVMRDDSIVERIWKRDHTVWKPDPAEIADRLGWLTVAEDLRARTPELRDIAARAKAEGFTRAVVLGMGGSSLAAETMRRIFGNAGGMTLHILDSTHPAAVARVGEDGDLAATLFVVASKSGTTIETLCHLQYFFGRIQRGDHFVAVTDPQTPLAALAEGHGFRGAFLNPADIGGRYSALSLFGLVPAALAGYDIDGLLDAAVAEAAACRSAPGDNPAALLGATLGEAALAGRDKATFVLEPPQAPLGLWVEQLVAESTGKQGTGLVPVTGEPDALPPAHGDRVFAVFGDQPWVPAPFVRDRPLPLGGAFFRLELATAIAGYVLGINPFDQPNVAEAKEATARILSDPSAARPELDDARPLLDRPMSYLGILAYVDPTPENEARLEASRIALRDRLGVAVTAGFGPRYLHSTGQLHKGGPDGGAFLMVLDDHRADDIPVPGRGFTFGTLIDAQAAGDFASLRTRGREVARVTMETLESLAT